MEWKRGPSRRLKQKQPDVVSLELLLDMPFATGSHKEANSKFM